MSENSYSRTVTIVNSQGLHLRPAKLFVEVASKFRSQVEVIKDDLRIDGKSILSILTLGAAQGSQIRLAADGPDSHAAVDALAKLVESGFSDEACVLEGPDGQST
jgi:phosphotransferase system HPr (HPr) family protein